MNHLLKLFVAAGLVFGTATLAQAAPVAAGLARTAETAAEASAALVTDVSYRRGYRRVAYGRPIYRPRYRARPVIYGRPYARPVIYGRPYARPVYYRPVRYRPVYAAPVYYDADCWIRYRKVYTVHGLVRKPVRVCAY